MGKTINLLGATYNNVPAVTLPSGNSTATFYDVSGADAVKANVLYPKYFVGVNGLEQGSMADNGSINGSISTKSGTVTIPEGYTSGGSVGLANTEKNKIIAQNIRSGVSILGQAGNLLDWTTFPLALQTVEIHFVTNGNSNTDTLLLPQTDLGGRPIKYLQITQNEDPSLLRVTSTGTASTYLYTLTYNPDKVLFKSKDNATPLMWWGYFAQLELTSNKYAVLNAYRNSSDSSFSLLNENQLSQGYASVRINSGEYFRRLVTFIVVIGG